MILDKEDHRKLLLEIIGKSHFPGTILEAVLELKQAVVTAKISEKDPDGKTKL